MKAVMLAVQPKWVEKIANGKKTIEVRKTAPKCGVPFKGYIYVTKGKPYLYRVDDDDNFELTNTLRPKVYEYVKDYNEQNGNVIGEFVCDSAEWMSMRDCDKACMTLKEAVDYSKGKKLYAWHISDLKIYDKPKELSEFYTIDESGSDCCIACVYHETPLEEMPCRTCTGERRYLYRPPQSWQYVEELQE